jgi:hypothetical protein
MSAVEIICTLVEEISKVVSNPRLPMLHTCLPSHGETNPVLWSLKFTVSSLDQRQQKQMQKGPRKVE